MTSPAINLTKPATEPDDTDRHGCGRTPHGAVDPELLAADVDKIGGDIGDIEQEMDQLRGRVHELEQHVQGLEVDQHARYRGNWHWFVAGIAWLAAFGIVAVMMFGPVGRSDPAAVLDQIVWPLAGAVVAMLFAGLIESDRIKYRR